MAVFAVDDPRKENKRLLFKSAAHRPPNSSIMPSTKIRKSRGTRTFYYGIPIALYSFFLGRQSIITLSHYSAPSITEEQSIVSASLSAFKHQTGAVKRQPNSAKTPNREEEIHAEDTPEWAPCRPVFFVGGGKSGSTMLASWLKHSPETNYTVYTPASGFLDGPKEIGFKGKRHSGGNTSSFLHYFHPTPLDIDHCPGKRQYLLDGSPKWRTCEELKSIDSTLENNTKFILLARDPVDRLVSLYNDNRPPRRTLDIDKKVKKKRSSYDPSFFGAQLHEAISAVPGDRIMVVINEIMKVEPQAVMDDVYDFLGHKRLKIKVGTHPSNCNKCLTKFYTEPTEETKVQVRANFRPDAERFMELLGTNYLPWKTVETTQAIQPQTPTEIKVAGYEA